MDQCIPKNTLERRYGSYATTLTPFTALNLCISELSAAQWGRLVTDLLNSRTVKRLRPADV